MRHPGSPAPITLSSCHYADAVRECEQRSQQRLPVMSAESEDVTTWSITICLFLNTGNHLFAILVKRRGAESVAL